VVGRGKGVAAFLTCSDEREGEGGDELLRPWREEANHCCSSESKEEGGGAGKGKKVKRADPPLLYSGGRGEGG